MSGRIKLNRVQNDLENWTVDDLVLLGEAVFNELKGRDLTGQEVKVYQFRNVKKKRLPKG